MSEAAIKVSNISKRYRLGLKENQAETFVGQVGNLIKSPWQNLKRLRQMSQFHVEDESVFWALKDINFEVKEGEVLGIIGKNGAGKSTLLKILSQITEPTSGKIEIYGRVASLLEVGTGFHPELTGRENIYMNGTILGMTRREIDSKLDEIIDFSGIEKFIDTPVKFYSSGMKVRLGFSVAAHLEPEILIIDEVLAVGDYEFQQKCLGKMEDVSKNQGRTVIFVSHDMSSINSLCNRTILLSKGEISIDSNTLTAVDLYFKNNYHFDYEDRKDLSKHPNKMDPSRGIISYLMWREGNETDYYFSQEKFQLELKFLDPSGITNIVFGLVIKDSKGRPIIGINTLDLESQLNTKEIVEGVLIFEIERIPIYAEGQYFIDLYFGEGGDNYDIIENALSFYIKATPIFRKGYFLKSQYNLVHPGKVSINLKND